MVRFGFEHLFDRRTPPTLWFPLPYSTQVQDNDVVDGGEGVLRTVWNFPCCASTAAAADNDAAAEQGGGEAATGQVEWFCMAPPSVALET